MKRLSWVSWQSVRVHWRRGNRQRFSGFFFFFFGKKRYGLCLALLELSVLDVAFLVLMYHRIEVANLVMHSQREIRRRCIGRSILCRGAEETVC